MNWKRMFLSLILLVIIFLIYNYGQISKIYINKLKLSTSKLSKQIRVTQITDFHSNDRVDLDKLVESISDFTPDIIVLTGDIIDRKTRDLSQAFQLIEGIKNLSSNIYFVSGNHELSNPISEDFYEGLNKHGIKVLDNKSELIKYNGEKIKIFGASFFDKKEDYDELFKDISKDHYNILLSHSPNRPIKYLNENVDLILSGHTHGGQVRLPILGGIIAPGQGLFPKYDKGVFELGSTILYIDSGLGNSMYPLRLFNPVQITNIVLE
jgi:predicted MPP superfamily phosphohydrolase